MKRGKDSRYEVGAEGRLRAKFLAVRFRFGRLATRYTTAVATRDTHGCALALALQVAAYWEKVGKHAVVKSLYDTK